MMKKLVLLVLFISIGCTTVKIKEKIVYVDRIKYPILKCTEPTIPTYKEFLDTDDRERYLTKIYDNLAIIRKYLYQYKNWKNCAEKTLRKKDENVPVKKEDMKK